MNRRVNDYQALLAEKARLTALLEVQKEQIRLDIEEIREDLKPVENAVSTATMFFTRSFNGKGLTHFGVNVVVDLLVKRLLLSKAGWFTRNLIPYFLKNYTSHLIDDPAKVLEKLTHIFRKKDHPGMEAV